MQQQNTDTIASELDLDDLPEEERNALLDDIGEVLFQGVMVRVLNALDDEQADTLSDLFEASNSDPDNDEKREAIYSFITEQVPEFEHFVTEEAELLRAAQQDVLRELESAEPTKKS